MQNKQLFESDFLTFNLSSLRNATTKQAAADDVNKSVENEYEKTNANKNERQIKLGNDWAKELENRLAANRNLSKDARQAPRDIETKFFKDFFTSVWNDDEIVKQLILVGELLKKTFKQLGFSKSTNPIFNFLTLEYVKEELLKTKLINIRTFKVLLYALTEKKFKQSEFMGVNTYNIIYCKDFYKQTTDDMIKFIDLQYSIFGKPDFKSNKDKQLKNRQVLLQIESNKEQTIDSKIAYQNNPPKGDDEIPFMTEDSVKLNSYVFAKAVHTSNNGDSIVAKTHLPQGAQNKLVQKLNTPAKILAAIQYLSVNTNSEEAREAVHNDRLRSVSMENLLKATNWLSDAKIMPKGNLATKDANNLVHALLDKL